MRAGGPAGSDIVSCFPAACWPSGKHSESICSSISIQSRFCAHAGAPARLLFVSGLRQVIPKTCSDGFPALPCQMNLDFHNLRQVHVHVGSAGRRRDMLPRSRLPPEFQASFEMGDNQVHVLDLCHLRSGFNRDAWMIKVESVAAKLAVEFFFQLLPFPLPCFMTFFFCARCRPLTRALSLLFRLRAYGSGFAFL